LGNAENGLETQFLKIWRLKKIPSQNQWAKSKFYETVMARLQSGPSDSVFGMGQKTRV
jgi:hypothetical protein